MARALLFSAAVLAAVAMATPTAPFVSDAYTLPVWYLYESTPGEFNVTQTQPAVYFATAQYNASNYDLGWDYLSVTPRPYLVSNASSRGNGYYFAGVAEGLLTAKTFQRMGVLPTVPGGQVGDWVNEHLAFMRQRAAALGATDAFWNQVGALLQQMQGIADGATRAGVAVTFENIFMINFGDEIGDVTNAVHWQHDHSARIVKKHPAFTHCSALIKVVADDLYMSHDTWSGFPSMTQRIYKVYNFETTVTLSAYPGTIASGDDWYMTSNQLAVQETTNDFYNNSLYAAIVPNTVSEFIRVMAANYLATDGVSWTSYFSRHNSGTYSNQYMVVDFKLYVPGASIVDNTLWIAEQIPGLVQRGDVSWVLRDKGYWASFNIPYFRNIYDLSGFKANYEEYGTFWSYTKYARPEIFRRNHSDVVDIATMQRMMRYNNYKNDPLSTIPNCTGTTNGVCDPDRSAMLSIASRGDLMEDFNSTAAYVAHYGPLYLYVRGMCFGAIDSKIATWKNRHTLAALIISGPTNDQQPTFSWNTGACTGMFPPAGTPMTMDHPWVWFNRVPNPEK